MYFNGNGMRILIFLTLVLLVSCKAQQVSLTQIEWKLIKMEGVDLSALDQPVTLTLDETTNKVSGFAGCNHFFGTYQSDGATISFTGLGSTKMYCQKTIAIEDAYFKLLGSIQSFKLEENRLLLLAGEQVVLEFSK